MADNEYEKVYQNAMHRQGGTAGADQSRPESEVRMEDKLDQIIAMLRQLLDKQK